MFIMQICTFTACILAYSIQATVAMTTYELQNVYNLTTLCPYTNFCTVNASVHGDTSCCSECSCLPECNMLGNCCPDAARIHQPEIDLRECYLPAHNYFVEYFNGIYGYQAFVRCPQTFTNQLIKQKCERVPQFMDELTVVSDKNDYVYKNRYCAECNGITEYNRWLLQIFCNGDDRHFYTLSWELNIPNYLKCVIWSHPKNITTSKQYRCFPQAVDKCNRNPYHEENTIYPALCASYTHYYFYIDDYINVYKNIHCFMCNDRLQFGDDDDDCPEKSIVQPRLSKQKVYFTGLLNFALLEQRQTAMVEKSKHQRNNCSSGYTYDPHFDKCRIVKCPWNYISVDTVCVPTYVKSSGVAMAAVFEAIAVNEASSIKDDLMYAPIRANLIRKLNIPCDVCNIRVGYFNATTLAVQISYLTNSKCVTDYLNKRLYEQSKSGDVHIRFAFNRVQHHFKLKMSLDVLSPLSIENSGRISHANDIFCSDVLVYRNELTCPKVTLDKEEFEQFQAKQKYNGRFQPFYPDVQSDGIQSNEIQTVVNRNMDGYHVCVDDYIMSMTSHNQPMTIQCTIFMIMMIKFSETACC